MIGLEELLPRSVHGLAVLLDGENHVVGRVDDEAARARGGVLLQVAEAELLERGTALEPTQVTCARPAPEVTEHTAVV